MAEVDGLELLYAVANAPLNLAQAAVGLVGELAEEPSEVVGELADAGAAAVTGVAEAVAAPATATARAAEAATSIPRVVGWTAAGLAALALADQIATGGRTRRAILGR